MVKMALEDNVTRELIAYALIGGVLFAALVVGSITQRQRRRVKLRRRGIKHHGH